MKKYHRFIIFIISICLLFGSVFWFARQVRDIKKNDIITMYGVDLIAFYTAAKLVRMDEPQEIYGNPGDNFIMNAGRFAEVAHEAGYHGSPTRYVYMPIFSVPFLLLTFFPFETASDIWLLFNLFIIAAVISIQVHMIETFPSKLLGRSLVTALNLMSFPLFYSLKLGQTTLIIYCLMSLLCLCVLRKKDAVAGIILGVMICVKISPLLLCLYFIYRRRARLVRTCMATVSGLLLVSVFCFGLSLHERYLSIILGVMGKSTAAWSNQSLGAFLMRHMEFGGAFNFTLAAEPFSVSVVKYIFFALIGAGIWQCFKKREENDFLQAFPLEFSVVVLIYLLVPGISWHHYYVMGILPVVFLLRNLDSARRHVLLLLSVGVAYCFISLPPVAVPFAFFNGMNGIIRLIISLPFFGAMLMLFSFFLLLHRQGDAISR